MSRSRKVFLIFWGLAAIEALATILVLLSIPRDPKNSIFLGFSLERLAMLGTAILAAALFLGASLIFWKNPVWAEKRIAEIKSAPHRMRILLWASGIVFLAGWVIVFIPSYLLLDYQSYFERLMPFFVLITLIAFQAFFILLIYHFGIQPQRLKEALHAEQRTLGLAAVLMAGLAVLVVIARVTGLGIVKGSDVWYDVGVPVLGIQMLVAWLAGSGLLLIQVARSRAGKEPTANRKWFVRLDIILFISLWVIAAAAWLATPLAPAYFAPQPRPPENSFLPYSDAAKFDVNAQSILIGEKINNGQFYDRALYIVFLAFLHLLAGQSYAAVAGLQVVILAVFPALLYLLGKALHSRPLGLMVAVAAILRGINAILAGTMIQTANPKLLMTDFPTAVLLLLFTYWMVRWMQTGGSNGWRLALAGGILGLATMLRTNPLGLLPLAALLAIPYSRRSWRRWIAAAALILTGALVSVLPWMIRNQAVSGSGLFYLQRLQDVITERYIPALRSATPTASPANKTKSTATAGAVGSQTTAEGSQATVVPTAAATPEATPVVIGEEQTQPVLGVTSYDQIIRFVAVHFSRNLVASTLYFPTTIFRHDLRRTIQTFAPYWNRAWDGSLNLEQILFLWLNFGLLSLGMAFAWKKWRWAGLTPLAVFLVYQGVNALARTSGGRYIAPVDWVILLYYCIGLMEATRWVFSLFSSRVGMRLEPEETPVDPQPSSKRSRWQITAVMAAFLLIGSTLPLSEMVFPQRYPSLTKQQLADQLSAEGVFEKLGYSQADVQAFLADKNSRVVMGRLLYPRYYGINEGEPSRANSDSVYRADPYPRVSFWLLGANGRSQEILPQIYPPEYFPNAADVIVVGCQYWWHIQVNTVVFMDGSGEVVARQPGSPLTCPQKGVKCDNNRQCK